MNYANPTTPAHSAGDTDIPAFVQEAGLQDGDEMDVVRSALIEWRGGGPGAWKY